MKPRPCCLCAADVESQTLQGVLAQLDPERSGLHQLENTTLDFQKLSNQEVLRMGGPLGADFTVKVRACWEARGRRPLPVSPPVSVPVSAGEAGGRGRQHGPVPVLPAHRPPLEGDRLLPLFRHLWGG